jgi:predicted O-methyltransferase YrrM
MTGRSIEQLRRILTKYGYPPSQGGNKENPIFPPLAQRDDPIFKLICETVKPRNIIEFGTWEGRSAVTWLMHAPQDATIVCVDTFLGSWEHFLDINPDSEFGGKNLIFHAGAPGIYQRFLQNIQDYGLTNRILPVCNTTQNAFEIMKRIDLKFDVVYVDAAHDYIPVMLDLEYAVQLVKKPEFQMSANTEELMETGGVILGDDFESWGTVASAVKDFCAQEKLRLFEGSNNWVITNFLSSSARAKLESELLDHGYSIVQNPIGHSETSIWEKARIEEMVQLQRENDELIGLRLDLLESEKVKNERDSVSYELELIKSSNFYKRYTFFVKHVDRFKAYFSN